MSLYRKKPVVIEAKQLTEDNSQDVASWILDNGGTVGRYAGEFRILTLEGAMHASLGDYVIRGVRGEFYPCKPDIFEATYESLTENS